ncbi:hypothetical protein GOODEAATRI_006903 [Goodea atripinnis]|uniref:Uncharacterized protein n=1 Tax=Goodea atripinnis TaxID=208336 RepID=A0ABV0PW63_9TELE
MLIFCITVWYGNCSVADQKVKSAFTPITLLGLHFLLLGTFTGSDVLGGQLTLGNPATEHIDCLSSPLGGTTETSGPEQPGSGRAPPQPFCTTVHTITIPNC